MKTFLKEALIIVGLAAVIYLLLQFVIQGVPVLGSSMEPTLESSGERIIVNRAALWFHGPQRGDVITFHPPKSWPNPPKLPFIKRVIGLPGDMVEIKSGKIYLNGSSQPLSEPYIKMPFTYSMALTKVPAGSYFVLGDNRNISEDSHLYGTIPRSSIIGKAWLVYWPPSLWGIVSNYNYATK